PCGSRTVRNNLTQEGPKCASASPPITAGSALRRGGAPHSNRRGGGVFVFAPGGRPRAGADPRFLFSAGLRWGRGEAALGGGVAICGSGVGASVCANKIPGIRAALIHDHFSARQGVEDDHMNILWMGGRTVGPAVAWDLVQTFLAAEFSQAERHRRRLDKVA